MKLVDTPLAQVDLAIKGVVVKIDEPDPRSLHVFIADPPNSQIVVHCIFDKFNENSYKYLTNGSSIYVFGSVEKTSPGSNTFKLVDCGSISVE